jgi:pyrroloquinoline quinone (PQQ) biosynthesis protein C
MSPEALREALLSVMDRKDHWAWPLFAQGKLSKAQLLVHFKQEWAVYVRDFPVFLARVLGKSPPAAVRRDLAENLYEEETGGLSAGRPHPELFLFLMEGLGYDLKQFEEVELLPEALGYRSFIDAVTNLGSWQEGAALSTIFIEGSKNDRVESDPGYNPPPIDVDAAIAAHPLVRYQGVDPRYLALTRAHKQVEGSHRIAAWRSVLTHTTGEEQGRVLAVMRRGLSLWQLYRDGVARAMGVEPVASAPKPR